MALISGCLLLCRYPAQVRLQAGPAPFTGAPTRVTCRATGCGRRCGW
jgi:hypothetical protein